MVDLNYAFHPFALDEESQELFVFYTPWGLYKYNTLMMGVSSASSECHERIRRIVEGLEGIQQIKDDIVVHGKGRSMTRGSRPCWKGCSSTTSHSGGKSASLGWTG